MTLSLIVGGFGVLCLLAAASELVGWLRLPEPKREIERWTGRVYERRASAQVWAFLSVVLLVGAAAVWP